MRIGGVYIGLGSGDSSAEIQAIKAFMRKKFSYAAGLADTPLFDDAMTATVATMQQRYLNAGKITADKFTSGVINLETKYTMGFLTRPAAVLPVIFTVEGHSSNMWIGPTASIASTLEGWGVALWRPTGYDCTALPFDNADGIEQLRIRVASLVFDDGKPFPAGTPWGLIGFSQGSMVACDFMRQHVLPENGSLHWRLKDFKRGLALGNPYREFGKCASWSASPPPADTGGIMLDNEFVTTGTAIQDLWVENCNNGDLFSVCTNDKSGLDRAAIAKIVTEDSWTGGPAAILTRVMAILGDVTGEAIPTIQAIITAVMFLVSNPNPHYSTVAEPGDISWMKGVAA